MDERDLKAEEALAGLGVDELGALFGQPCERVANVLHLVGDVVHAGSAAGDEAADRRVLTQRRQQLDPAPADEERGSLDALVVHPLTALQLCAEQTLVGGDSLVEVGNRDAEVVDAAGAHRTDATGCRRPC